MNFEIDDQIDLRGIPCPTNSAKALLKIATMNDGENLEIFVDDGEPFANVCESLEEDGHEILSKNLISESEWKVIIKINE